MKHHGPIDAATAAQLGRDVGLSSSAPLQSVTPVTRETDRKASMLPIARPPPADSPTHEFEHRTHEEDPEATMLSRNREALLRQTEKDYLLKLQAWHKE